MRTLVTGHKGFIGTHLTEELNRRKIPYVGFDRANGVDICDDLDSVDWWNIDKVVHLAAISDIDAVNNNPDDAERTNIIGTEKLLYKANHYGIDKFVFISSAAVYGPGQVPNDEEDKCEPENAYRETKLEGENLVGRYLSKGLDSVVFRLFNVYGEGGRGFINSLENCVDKGYRLQVNNSGKPTRDYVHVSDIVTALINGLGETPDLIYNVGTGIELSLNQVMSKYLHYNHLPAIDVKTDNGGADRSVADITKITRDFGWSSLSLDQYLRTKYGNTRAKD